MMINKRLIGAVPESKKYIAGNVAVQWASLAANICMMGSIAVLLQKLFDGSADTKSILTTVMIGVLALATRFVCALAASRMGYLSSKEVKATLREAIYHKLLRLGASYAEKLRTSEVVQVAVEGVDQLETYFGAYGGLGNTAFYEQLILRHILFSKQFSQSFTYCLIQLHSITIPVAVLIF